MIPTEVTLLTSKSLLFLGSIALVLFLAATFVNVHRKKDCKDFLYLAAFSAIIVILAKFNFFVPFT